MHDSYFLQTLKTYHSRQPVREWFAFLLQRIAHLSLNQANKISTGFLGFSCTTNHPDHYTNNGKTRLQHRHFHEEMYSKKSFIQFNDRNLVLYKTLQDMTQDTLRTQQKTQILKATVHTLVHLDIYHFHSLA